MMEKEVVLMKGNEAIAHAAIRCGWHLFIWCTVLLVLVSVQ